MRSCPNKVPDWDTIASLNVGCKILVIASLTICCCRKFSASEAKERRRPKNTGYSYRFMAQKIRNIEEDQQSNEERIKKLQDQLRCLQKRQKTLNEELEIAQMRKAGLNRSILEKVKCREMESFRYCLLRRLWQNDSITLETWKVTTDMNVNDSLKSFVMHEALDMRKNQPFPFKCLVDDLKHSFCGTVHYTTVYCTVKTSDKPPVDYSLSKELVYIEVAPKLGPGLGEWGKPATKKKFYGIAQFQTTSAITEGGEDTVVVTLTFLESVYNAMVYDFKKLSSVDVYHLGGLIPSERCYDSLQSGHRIEASLFQQKEITGESDSSNPCGHLEYKIRHIAEEKLDKDQFRVASCIPSLNEGLYCITGPPGTGKSLMNAFAIIILYIHHISNHERFLYTAPSNAAVCAGLKHLLSNRPDWMSFNTAFTGNPEKLPEEYRQHCIYWFADEKLEASFKKVNTKWFGKESAVTVPKMREVLDKKLQRAIDDIVSLLDEPRDKHVQPEVLRAIEKFRKNLEAKQREIAQLRTNNKKNVKSLLKALIGMIKNDRECFDRFMLQRADVVFSTLCGSGQSFLRKNITTFNVVIIDEAAQSTTAESLIPIVCYSPSVTVLVGDDKQLPPVVSLHAKEKGYDQSLMSSCNAVSSGVTPFLLRNNYRMKDSICRWPSRRYYDSKLVSSNVVATRNDIGLHTDTANCSFDFDLDNVFVDISTGSETKIGKSFENKAEAKAIASVIAQLGSRKDISIGIIAFYRAQVKLIKAEIKKRLESEADEMNLTVATVDGFQGGERDIIMVSAVRTRDGDAGFLKDSRRINVAMTRAKHRRWVFGHASSLESSQSDFSHFLSETNSELIRVEM